MVNGWQKLMSNVQELRARPSETEKITVNLGYVDLGHVDLMVQEGFYSNRTDFIRTAIRTIASISVWAPFMTARRSRTPWRTVCSSRRTSTKKSSCSKLGARPAPTLEQYSNEGASP